MTNPNPGAAIAPGGSPATGAADDPQTLRKHRSRGLLDLAGRIGDVSAEIETRLARASQVRVLEVGCGYGVTLLELRRKFGSRVSLVGINLTEADGNHDLMLRIAAERGLLTTDAAAAPLPQFLYFDVCQAWPLPDDSFDLIFSQHSFLWFADKIKPLEEINRLLAPDGVAHIDLLVKPAHQLADDDSIIIRDGENKIALFDHLQHFESISVIVPRVTPRERFRRLVGKCIRRAMILKSLRRHFEARKAPKPRPYLVLRKAPALDLGLTFVSSRSYLTLPGRREGVQSFYTLRR